MEHLNNKTKKQLIECIETLHKQIKGLEKDTSESQNLVKERQGGEKLGRTIFQSTGTSMLIIEEDKIISMANLQFEKLCGYSREEVEGKKIWTEFIVKDDLKRMKEYHRLRRISKDLSPTNYEFRLIDRKGHIKNIFLNVAMIPGTTKSVASLLDITELKNTEKALRGSEARWKALSKNSPALIILQDRNGKVLFINRPVSDRSRKKVVGKSVYNFIPPGFHEIASDCFKKVWKTGKQCSYSTQLKTAEGKVRHFDVWVNPVFEEKEVVAIVSSSIDVSEKKMAEEELRKREQFITDIFESIQDGISVLNPDLTVRHVNNVMNQWYKENLPLEGKKCYEVYHNADKPCDPCPSLRCLKSGKTERNEVPGLPGSSVENIELFSYPIKNGNSGEIIGVVEFVRNITERKKAEETLKSSEARLKILFEYAPDAYYLSDLKGNFLDGNKASEGILGYKKEDLIGKSFLKLKLLSVKELTKAAKLLEKKKDEATLVVSDNGIGFPDDIDFRNTETLGLQIVCDLVQQIDGKIELDKKHGTSFTVTFKP